MATAQSQTHPAAQNQPEAAPKHSISSRLSTTARPQPSMNVVCATTTGSIRPCSCSTSRCSRCAPLQDLPPHTHAGLFCLACPTQPGLPCSPEDKGMGAVQGCASCRKGRRAPKPASRTEHSVCVCVCPQSLASPSAHLLTVQCSQEVCFNHMLAPPTIDEGTPRPHPRQQLNIDNACRGVVAAAAAHSRTQPWQQQHTTGHSHGSSNMVGDRAGQPMGCVVQGVRSSQFTAAGG